MKKMEGTQNLDCIIEGLAILGANLDGKSMFLEANQTSDRIVMDFLKKYAISDSFFSLVENVLRFTNAFNCLCAMLDLKDKGLEIEILTRLKDPEILIKNYGYDKILIEGEESTARHLIETLYAFFIDDLDLPEKKLIFISQEMLTQKFMDILSRGQSLPNEDWQAWLVFSTCILADLNSLPEAILRTKKELGLK